MVKQELFMPLTVLMLPFFRSHSFQLENLIKYKMQIIH